MWGYYLLQIVEKLDISDEFAILALQAWAKYPHCKTVGERLIFWVPVSFSGVYHLLLFTTYEYDICKSDRGVTGGMSQSCKDGYYNKVVISITLNTLC